MTTFQKAAAVIVTLCAAISTFAANPPMPLLNEPVDISGDFRDFSDLYYVADRLDDFDPATHTGKITYQRSQYFTSMSFNHMVATLKSVGPNEFPANEYAANPSLPFSIEFVSPKTFRIRLASGPQFHKSTEELMLAGPVPREDSWKYEKLPAAIATRAGSVRSPFWKVHACATKPEHRGGVHHLADVWMDNCLTGGFYADRPMGF
jgi:alpha-D-xyloside xylohydrolase